MIPGLAERLEEELRFMLPTSSTVKVHGAPHRQHAAIQGASVLASLPNFSSLCVWNDDWQEGGPDVLRKWKEETLAPDMDYSDDEDDDDMVVRGGRGAPSGAAGSQRVFVDGDDEDEDDSGDSEAEGEEASGRQVPEAAEVSEVEESEEDDDDGPEDPEVGEEYI